jgi:peroxiredoxin
MNGFAKGLVIGVLAAGCGAGGAQSGPAVGDPAPAYAALTGDGDSVSLTELRGQPVLLNVWASWCLDCRKAIPALEALHRSFLEDGLRVVAVTIDEPTVNRELERFVRDLGLTFMILHDPLDEVSRSFRLPTVPTTLLIDRHGIIAHRWIGEFDPLAEDTQATIRRVLSDSTERALRFAPKT